MLKHRNSLQKSLCPIVLCPYLCSSDSITNGGGSDRNQTVIELIETERLRKHVAWPGAGGGSSMCFGPLRSKQYQHRNTEPCRDRINIIICMYRYICTYTPNCTCHYMLTDWLPTKARKHAHVLVLKQDGTGGDCTKTNPNF